MRRLLPLVALVLALAACGGSGAARTGHTVTFGTAGAFPTLTIVGRYSARGCAHDSVVIVGSARLFYEHSTTAPGPADLYYYDMREGYAHFLADDCMNAQLGAAIRHGLTGRQRSWLLVNLPSAFSRIFRTAEAAG